MEAFSKQYRLNLLEVNKILFGKVRTSPDYENFREIEASYEGLIQQVEQLKADKVRLDWLEERQYLCYGIILDGCGHGVRQIETEGYAKEGRNLRETIDNAMRESQ